MDTKRIIRLVVLGLVGMCAIQVASYFYPDVWRYIVIGIGLGVVSVVEVKRPD